MQLLAVYVPSFFDMINYLWLLLKVIFMKLFSDTSTFQIEANAKKIKIFEIIKFFIILLDINLT
ncbi:hypothetical protein AXF22_05000 [Prevotella scopos JCM 17725]|nr:hypothetical protein AXF22_05000 [Prevotella scopos JCM 17725]